ncbi:2-amino-4-hydroxy-6-hydroxymethyldihydropteridine diphosphokinase [Sphingomonas qomolangmaensis]|uniref:2-amino-4-hydroxy-6-hydroxymethyldihydropteridine pyrophosphokinase n=1 Tax=Sphingomonas qomolangmaensis TaxID=2918765 RepID=A0ABY5L5Z1_9SPHN|nr:2-amino-4-hydroxy-6-hydroxymethyldihydropteridine diphosphokinase [Sphingomonas qomolangmaensis]UUL81488.1 2-amino-4-hydroxy-6-hydroxymethyldihydropteridine diphosphokinase [Sphingomonas qomolangmaensis]
MQEATYLIALGSNRWSRHGGPRATLAAAVAALPGVIAAAPIVETAPIGPSRRRFANGAVLLRSDLPPPAMLAALKAIEAGFGRRPGQRWGARVLDLDIILWSGGIFTARSLAIPHVAFRSRSFALAPAAAIAPRWRDPVTGLSLAQLAARLARLRPVDRKRARP